MSEPRYRKVFYERYVGAFKAHTLPPNDYEFSDSKLAPLLDSWIANLPRDTACLDLGCGSGNILHYLSRRGFVNLSGVDISPEQVAMAKTITSHAHHADIFEYLGSLPDGSQGLITIFDVLEHLQKDELLELMEQCSKKLAPGGVLIAHTPNGDSPFFGQVLASDFTHETILNPVSAATLCRIVGLDGFEAKEHLGASRGISGRLRAIAWHGIRSIYSAMNMIECGNAGSGIWTRNFAFRTEKARKNQPDSHARITS